MFHIWTQCEKIVNYSYKMATKDKNLISFCYQWSYNACIQLGKHRPATFYVIGFTLVAIGGYG